MYMKDFLLAIFISRCVLAQDDQGSPDLIVNTKLGQVRGVPASDGDYSMFLGIPYAEVDESNPFGPSNPHPRYEGIFDANDDSHICPQLEEFNATLVGDLDCLRLNIFVPATASPSRKLPVLVWIYGGYFMIGFYGRFLFGPKFFMKHDIILVTINYRVGPYGFMCLDRPEVPGNQGLKDQALAMKWLYDNIEAFGGDPDQMTFSGNSAGGMSIDLHLIRDNDGPKIIDKAILQSGAMFTPNFQRALDAPLILSELLGFSTDDVTQALEFLALEDPHNVVQATDMSGLHFSPCIEKEFNDVEAFISKNPLTTTLVPSVKDMPIIIGFNSDESYATVFSSTDSEIGKLLAERFDTTHEDFAGMEDIVRHFFYGDESTLVEANIQPTVDLRSDMSFVYASIRSLKRFVENDAKAYLYMFSYNGEMNFVQHNMNIRAGGAWHADEVSYLFDVSYMSEPTPEDQLIIDRMTLMWANFVKTGNPTPETSILLPFKWQPIKKDSPRHFLNIDTEMSTGSSPYNKRMTFWDLFFETNRHLEFVQHL